MRALILAVVLTGLIGALAACGSASKSSTGPASGGVPGPILASTEPPQLFSPDSIWNQAQPADAPLDPESAQLAGRLAAEASREQRVHIGPWIATDSYSVPLYQVPASQPTVPVTLDNPAAYKLTLGKAFAAVPMPAGARQAPGTDSELAVWQPQTDRLWEFFQAHREADGWHANWGGAMEHVSRNLGWFSHGVWPGAQDNWGASGTGLALAGGLIRVSELQRGRIDHALALALPTARAGCRAQPAPRTDGLDPSPRAIPEGAHFRLDPKLDVRALHLPRTVQAMALAAQRYGIVVRDKTAHAIGFFAEDPHRLGHDPYPLLFDGLSPRILLSNFPWSHLQLLKMTLACP